MTLLAAHRRRHADGRLLALERVGQADLHVVAQIRAAPAAGPTIAALTHELAEHLIEDVGEAGAEIEASGASTGRSRALLERGVAEPVIGRTLLLVLQDVVGLVDFLELALGLRITRIAVRVILHRQLAIGLLDRILIGAAVDPKDLIEIAIRHG